MTPPPARPRVIVTRRLPEAVEARLTRAYGATLNSDDHQFSRAELEAALAEFDVVLCTLTDPLDRATLDAVPAPRARLLANFGVGFNHIDLGAARGRGLVVTNTPGVLTEDTADLTMLLLLAVARRAWEGERELREGRWTGWRPTHLLGTRVHGKALGIVGFGRIGQAVARRAHAGFGMRVRYVTRRISNATAPTPVGAEPCDTLDELLASSDFVSLHTPASPETHHLMNHARLARMQPSAFLINTSRGDVVDEDALIDALDRRVLAGAALDVYEGEPHVSPRLRARDDVFLLPHLGSATVAARVAMGMRAADNIDAFLDGRDPPDRIA